MAKNSLIHFLSFDLKVKVKKPGTDMCKSSANITTQSLCQPERRYKEKQTNIGSIPLQHSFFFRICDLWALPCSVATNNDWDMKMADTTALVNAESFRQWQYSIREWLNFPQVTGAKQTLLVIRPCFPVELEAEMKWWLLTLLASAPFNTTSWMACPRLNSVTKQQRTAQAHSSKTNVCPIPKLFLQLKAHSNKTNVCQIQNFFYSFLIKYAEWLILHIYITVSKAATQNISKKQHKETSVNLILNLTFYVFKYFFSQAIWTKRRQIQTSVFRAAPSHTRKQGKWNMYLERHWHVKHLEVTNKSCWSAYHVMRCAVMKWVWTDFNTPTYSQSTPYMIPPVYICTCVYTQALWNISSWIFMSHQLHGITHQRNTSGIIPLPTLYTTHTHFANT